MNIVVLRHAQADILRAYREKFQTRPFNQGFHLEDAQKALAAAQGIIDQGYAADGSSKGAELAQFLHKVEQELASAAYALRTGG